MGWLQWGIKGTDIFRDSVIMNMFSHHVIVPTVEVGRFPPFPPLTLPTATLDRIYVLGVGRGISN